MGHSTQGTFPCEADPKITEAPEEACPEVSGHVSGRVYGTQVPPKAIFQSLQHKKRSPQSSTLYGPFISFGAEGETRTPMPLPALDPEPSVSTNSTTSALL